MDDQQVYLLCRHVNANYAPMMIAKLSCGKRSLLLFSRIWSRCHCSPSPSSSSFSSSPFLSAQSAWGETVPPSQWDHLKSYEQLLLHWNQSINLISRNDTKEEDCVMIRHILPCLAIRSLDPFQKGQSIVDVG